MKISFVAADAAVQGALIVGIYQDRGLSAAASQIEAAQPGYLARAMDAGRFDGKKDQILTLIAPPGVDASRLLLLGLGNPAEWTETTLTGFGGAVTAALLTSGVTAATLAWEDAPDSPVAAAQAAALVALGGKLRSYRFDKYRTTQKKDDKPSLKTLALAVAAPEAVAAAYAPKAAVAKGVFLTRDLASEPANVIYPESLAAEASELAELGLEVEILGEKQMRKLGMGALLGVGQGSDRESQLVVMRWNGHPDAATKPVAFVGKGVTFDSGGISIKPAEGMEDMKWDMGGAAVVTGLMKTLALRKAKANVVGVLGLVENMPSGTAQRPGDVVTSMSGQTIEVINTDAEGRLVLADALHYTETQYQPQAIIDLATLTGAIIISLGSQFAGLFSTDDTLADALAGAGKAVGERLWRMPLDEGYEKQIKSDIADVKNTGGREGGSITAALFLKKFVKNTPWAHLDIAGVTWAKADLPVVPKGASAFGVRLLDRLVADHYEAQTETP